MSIKQEIKGSILKKNVDDGVDPKIRGWQLGESLSEETQFVLREVYELDQSRISDIEGAKNNFSLRLEKLEEEVSKILSSIERMETNSGFESLELSVDTLKMQTNALRENLFTMENKLGEDNQSSPDQGELLEIKRLNLVTDDLRLEISELRESIHALESQSGDKNLSDAPVQSESELKRLDSITDDLRMEINGLRENIYSLEIKTADKKLSESPDQYEAELKRLDLITDNLKMDLNIAKEDLYRLEGKQDKICSAVLNMCDKLDSENVINLDTNYGSLTRQQIY